MEIVARFHSPFGSKFGVPRQSGLAMSLPGVVVFEPSYRAPEALRGIEGFEFVWLLWGFSAAPSSPRVLTVRPPRLGGNKRMGVFATRSPFRPNGIGLSSVRLLGVEHDHTLGMVLRVAGADLMDGTPIYDIKPYLPYTDAHPGAKAGWVDNEQWRPLKVVMPDGIANALTQQQKKAITETLALDPRPHYHDNPDKTYGMIFDNRDVRFKVNGDTLTVVAVEAASEHIRHRVAQPEQDK